MCSSRRSTNAERRAVAARKTRRLFLSADSTTRCKSVRPTSGVITAWRIERLCQDAAGEGVERSHARIEARDELAADELLPNGRAALRDSGGQPEPMSDGPAGRLQDLAVLVDERVRLSTPGRTDADGDLVGHFQSTSGFPA